MLLSAYVYLHGFDLIFVSSFQTTNELKANFFFASTRVSKFGEFNMIRDIMDVKLAAAFVHVLKASTGFMDGLFQIIASFCINFLR